jgi:hypothetical protein
MAKDSGGSFQRSWNNSFVRTEASNYTNCYFDRALAAFLAIFWRCSLAICVKTCSTRTTAYFICSIVVPTLAPFASELFLCYG